MIWQSIAEQQARTIEELAKLCRKMLDELAQYRNIDEEERMLRELEVEDP